MLQQLIDYVNVYILEDFQQYVVLVFDEMKIKEKLVYNHNSGVLHTHVHMKANHLIAECIILIAI